MSYIANTFHTPDNFSALSWDRMKTKPVLSSYINRLSIMGHLWWCSKNCPCAGIMNMRKRKTLFFLGVTLHCMNHKFFLLNCIFYQIIQHFLQRAWRIVRLGPTSVLFKDTSILSPVCPWPCWPAKLGDTMLSFSSN